MNFGENWNKLKDSLNLVINDDIKNVNYQTAYLIVYRLCLNTENRMKLIEQLNKYNEKLSHKLNKKKVDTINSILLYLCKRYNYEFKLINNKSSLDDFMHIKIID